MYGPSHADLGCMAAVLVLVPASLAVLITWLVMR